MTQTGNQKLTDRFIQFYRNYYRDDVGRLAQEYPDESRSLYVDYNDLYTFDRDLAEDYVAKPQQMQEYAEEALRLYDIPAEVNLGQAHVRLRDLPSEFLIEISEIRVSNDVVGSLIAVDAYVQEASDVDSVATEVAFECQRCGTMTFLPQTPGEMIEEPHECKGCEREGPFAKKVNQSEYVDSQTATIVPLPESETGSSAELEIYLEDDIAGSIAEGDRRQVVGVLLGDMDRAGKLDYRLEVVSVDALENIQDGFWDAEYLDDSPAEALDEEAVGEFATRSRAILETQTLDESATRTKVITPFISLLGWRVYHPEVALEYTSEALGKQDRADYVLLDDDSNPAVVVEAKQEGSYLSGHEGQLKRYMRNFGANLGILTDGESFLFLCSDPRSDVPEEIELLSGDLDSLESNLNVLELFVQDNHVGQEQEQSVVGLVTDQVNQMENGQLDASAVDVDEEKDETEVVKGVISQVEEVYDEGAPIEEVMDRLVEMGYTQEEGEEIVTKLRKMGELYEPIQNYLRTT